MIEVEVGLDDVADVCGIQAQRADLLDRGERRVDRWTPVDMGERPSQPGGDRGVVGAAQAGVDQYQTACPGLHH